MVISSKQFGRNLKQYIYNTIRGFERPALVGKKYADGKVFPRGRNDGSYNDLLSQPWVYVRMWGDDSDVREALAVNINPAGNLSVVVRENWEGDLTIIRLNDRQAYAGFGDAAGAYSSGATYMEATSAIVGARNLRMGRVRLAEASSLKVTADAFVYYDLDGTPQRYSPSGVLDLATYLPGSTNEKRYVLISFNRDSSSPELVATAGDIKTVLTFPDDALNIALPAHHIPLAIVELRNGDTALTETRFFEWRVLVSHVAQRFYGIAEPANRWLVANSDNIAVQAEFSATETDAYTAVEDAGNPATIIKALDKLSVQISGDVASAYHALLWAYAPAGDYYVETAVRVLASTGSTPRVGLIAADGNTYSAGNQIALTLDLNIDGLAPTARELTGFDTAGTTGALNAFALAPQSQPDLLYLRMLYDSTATEFTLQMSADGVQYVDVGTYTLSFTATHVGVAATTDGDSNPLIATFEYIRAYDGSPPVTPTYDI